MERRRERRASDPKWHAREKRKSAAYRRQKYHADAAWRERVKAGNRARGRLHQRRYTLQKLYGVPLEAFEALFAEQGQSCAICRSDDPLGKGWCLDHDHATGRIRGVLCNLCNRGVGCFRDRAEYCERAAEYVVAHR